MSHLSLKVVTSRPKLKAKASRPRPKVETGRSKPKFKTGLLRSKVETCKPRPKFKWVGPNETTWDEGRDRQAWVNLGYPGLKVETGRPRLKFEMDWFEPSAKMSWCRLHVKTSQSGQSSRQYNVHLKFNVEYSSHYMNQVEEC